MSEQAYANEKKGPERQLQIAQNIVALNSIFSFTDKALVTQGFQPN
ncbi:MAG TPA: hypothetical protein PLP17_14850 [Oligoflexia bacterium]|nr:hypothetical protein [Oligoflexia bacterium]